MKEAVNYDPWDEAHVDCFWSEGVADGDSGLEKTTFKNIPVHIIQNSIKLKTFTN